MERSGSVSSLSSGSSGISRLPRFTPKSTPVSTTSALSNRTGPDFKRPKPPSVQALSLAIKKRYSTGRRAPVVQASPTKSRPVPLRQSAKAPSILGKRNASDTTGEPPKKPRVLAERNRPVVTRRPGPTAQQDVNKAGPRQNSVAKSRAGKTEPNENSDAAGAASSSAGKAPPKRKVQPWDIKGKLELSQETVKKLREELDIANSRITDLEGLTGSAEGTISSLRSDLAAEKAVCARQVKAIEDRDALLREAELDKERLQRTAEEEKRNLQQTAEAEKRNLQHIVDTAKADLLLRDERIQKLELQVSTLQSLCDEQSCEIDKLHDLRKMLHNQVQDLKGNIRVLCRVRPPTPKEANASSPLCYIQYNDLTSLELYKLKEEVGAKKKTLPSFSFDRVFPAGSTQEDVYAELDQLVQSCLDGYNVCVFAYGQTGSGKTFTMDGLDEPASERGMIPRTVDTIFHHIEKLKQRGWEYSAEVFFVEIYNEQIHDLLNYNSGQVHEVRMVPNKKSDVFVSNLKVEKVESQEELNALMSVARNNRFVASTVCNTHSSRSHFIMKIAVTGTNAARQLTCSGSISLVDLAGSERYEDSNSVDRRKETMCINKSLSSLTNVIMALKQKNDHVPYRVSKLTHLLMPCLGGSSKTLMIVNISPLRDCFSESVNSLRFANSVNQCQVVAKKNEKSTATL